MVMINMAVQVLTCTAIFKHISIEGLYITVYKTQNIHINYIIINTIRAFLNDATYLVLGCEVSSEYLYFLVSFHTLMAPKISVLQLS